MGIYNRIRIYVNAHKVDDIFLNYETDEIIRYFQKGNTKFCK